VVQFVHWLDADGGLHTRRMQNLVCNTWPTQWKPIICQKTAIFVAQHQRWNSVQSQSNGKVSALRKYEP